jgi:signal transduction histidine kinase
MGLVRAWRRTPLWLRLISAMLALVALGLMLTGTFGVRLLRGYLVERVDEQLDAAVDELMQEGVQQTIERQTSQVPSPFHLALLDAEGDAVLVQRSALNRSAPSLPHLTPEQASDRAGDPFTVDSSRGAGSWRVVTLPIADSSGSVVMAMTLDEVDATVKRLVQIDILVGIAVLAGLAVVGITMVRTALRPLDEIELTAAAIGRGDLGRRVPDHHPGTEMGRLSRALNAMLEQVERAFGARAASEARARRSEQRMRRFIADASHELRTPLTSIRGFAELHRQGAVTDPAEVSELLARIEAEATRMGLLVDDLLLLARLDQRRPLERTPVDLASVAQGAVEAARAAAPDREVTLADAAPAVVAGDEAGLRQVTTNLLDNALAYSPDDTPVAVRVRRAERDGRALAALEVVDRGQGLTPEQAERVFERFYRTDAARSRARGGTGLGLSIVAAIVEAHGGTVEVDSAPGEGSTFRVLVPLAPDEPDDPDGTVVPDEADTAPGEADTSGTEEAEQKAEATAPPAGDAAPSDEPVV